MENLRANQRSWVFKNSPARYAEGQVKHVFGVLKWNPLDASKQFERCYRAKRPSSAGTVTKQLAPFRAGYQAAVDSREDVRVKDGYGFQAYFRRDFRRISTTDSRGILSAHYESVDSFSVPLRARA